MSFFSKKKRLAAAIAVGIGLAASQGYVAPSTVSAAKQQMVMDTAELLIEGSKDHSDAEIKRLIPEATRKQVRVSQLSKQVQMVNDSQVMKVVADFQPAGEGKYKLVLKVEDLNNNKVNLNVNNFGNDYTGNWRASVNYVNTDLTRNGDALGLTYMTSLNHSDDVRQAAAAYRMMFPNSGDSLYIAYTYSDVDLGTIPMGQFGLDATGNGHTVGVHYQRNMLYTGRHKQILDFGVDYKDYKNNQEIPVIHYTFEAPYKVTNLVLNYYDITRLQNQFLSWDLGYVTNLSGSKTDYERARANSDIHYHIFKAGINYQYRTNSDWIFGVKGNAQYTSNNLVYSEQLGAGGYGSVRGFKERVATADKGVAGSLEIYTPQFLKNSRFVLFLDAASLSNNTTNPGERGSRSLASWGVGYRFFDTVGGLSASLDWANVISDGHVQSKDTRPWLFTITQSF